MKPTTLPLLASCAFLFVSCGKKQAANVAPETKEESIVLAQRHFLPAAGTIATKNNTMTMLDAAMTVKAGPQELPGKMTRTEAGKETLEILAPHKVRRLLVSKSTSGKMTINGTDQPVPEKPDPLAGKPVIVEQVGGKWSATLEEGGTPSPAQQGRLTRMAKEAERDSDFEMYGDTPRKVGDKWSVDPGKLMSFGDAEALSGDYKVELVELKEVAGVRCAVLKAVFDFKGKTEAEGDDPQMDIRFVGDVVATRSIVDMIDLDVEMNATVTLAGTPAPQVSMHVEGPMRMTEKVSLKKP